MHQLDQEQTNASTVPLLPFPPLAIVEGGGQEQTNASTDPGANECINCTSPSPAATCHIYPKRFKHFFVLPIRPNTRFAAG